MFFYVHCIRKVFLSGGASEAVKPELGSVKSSDLEDNFKVPDGKLVIKSETSESDKSKTVMDDKVETDGVATETSTKSETEVPRVISLGSELVKGV